MSEEMIDIEVRMPKETVAIFSKLTKKELLNHLYVLILKVEVQTETIDKMSREKEAINKKVQQAVNKLEDKLGQAEEYGEQARAMIEAVMERWYNYDVD